MTGVLEYKDFETLLKNIEVGQVAACPYVAAYQVRSEIALAYKHSDGKVYACTMSEVRESNG